MLNAIGDLTQITTANAYIEMLTFMWELSSMPLPLAESQSTNDHSSISMNDDKRIQINSQIMNKPKRAYVLYQLIIL